MSIHSETEPKSFSVQYNINLYKETAGLELSEGGGGVSETMEP